MGRDFTVNFRYKEQPVTALVNLRDQGYDLSCMVRYLDQDIETMVPEGKLVFSLGNGLQAPRQLTGQPQLELFSRTSEAISRYLGAF
ncbi:MAG: hypothetical protein JWP27_1020 [Flaviaesturariibacter sp.]|nr:hypothetical protein [Flaviaesturariibacter sp.]